MHTHYQNKSGTRQEPMKKVEHDMTNHTMKNDKNLIIPRALYATTKYTFKKDISKLEHLYSKKQILSCLKNTKERISNDVCVMVAKRYNEPPFYRFRV